MSTSKYKRSKEHIAFRELCFDFQFAENEDEREDILKQMIAMKDSCDNDCEIKEMVKSINANIESFSDQL